MDTFAHGCHPSIHPLHQHQGGRVGRAAVGPPRMEQLAALDDYPQLGPTQYKLHPPVTTHRELALAATRKKDKQYIARLQSRARHDPPPKLGAAAPSVLSASRQATTTRAGRRRVRRRPLTRDGRRMAACGSPHFGERGPGKTKGGRTNGSVGLGFPRRRGPGVPSFSNPAGGAERRQ